MFADIELEGTVMGVLVPEPFGITKYKYCPMCGCNHLERFFSFWKAKQVCLCNVCGFVGDRNKFYRMNPFGTLGLEGEETWLHE